MESSSKPTGGTARGKWIAVVLVIAFVLGGALLLLLLPSRPAPQPIPEQDSALSQPPEAEPEEFEAPPPPLDEIIQEEDGEKPAPFSTPDPPNVDEEKNQ